MEKLYLDAETFSNTPITHGTHRYSDDPDIEVMLVTYAIDDGEEKDWDLTAGDPMPEDLRLALESNIPVVIQNSHFDRTVMRKTGLIDLPCSRIIDTMVQAYCHGLPGALDKLGKVFGLREDQAKMKEGRALIHFFCKLNKGKRNTRLTHPEKWKRFREYARRDITTMRIVHKKMPTWNYPGRNFPAEPSSEHRLWCIDQRINDRGFAVDLELATAAVACSAEEKNYLNERTLNNTRGEVAAATQRDKLLKHILESYGVTLPDMKADTLQRRIEDENLPLELRQLLDLRLQSSRNSASKYSTIIKAVSPDRRMRGCIQFAGAPATGRMSGKLFQPQNCMRPTMKVWQVLEAIARIKDGTAGLLFNNLPEVLGNCVRGVIVAPEGRQLIACDLKSIEGRGLAWLSGEDHITQFYHDFDAGRIKYDSYMLAYAMCFGIDPMLVDKLMRQIGKPIELGFGYGGGVAAFLTFALTYHLDLDVVAERVWATGDRKHLEECMEKWTWAKDNGYHAGMGKVKYAAFEYVKQKWRAARPKTVQFWNELAEGFKMATLYADTTFQAGPIKFYRQGQWLRLRLPSGRNLNFLQPQADGKGLSFMGMDRYTRQWSRVYTHGGKLSGLVTQAFASDILRDCEEPIENDGFDIVLTVHDEVVAEADLDRTVEQLAAHMIKAKAYAPGLPLAADGFASVRYRKED